MKICSIFPVWKKKKIKLMLYLKVVQFVVFLFCCLFVAAFEVVFLFVCLPVCLFRDVVVFNSFKAEKKLNSSFHSVYLLSL